MDLLGIYLIAATKPAGDGAPAALSVTII